MRPDPAAEAVRRTTLADLRAAENLRDGLWVAADLNPATGEPSEEALRRHERRDLRAEILLAAIVACPVVAVCGALAWAVL